MKAKTKFSKPSRACVRARGHFRELNVCEYRELYALCRGYARKWFGRHKMPLGDLDDIIVVSVHDAYERICRTREVRNLSGFMKTVAFRTVASALTKQKTGDNHVFIDAIPDDEAVEGGFFVSDEGAGVERIIEDIDGEKPEPEWLRLFRAVRERLPESERRVLDALEKDRRPGNAAKIAGISRSGFYKILKKFKSTSPNVIRPIVITSMESE